VKQKTKNALRCECQRRPILAFYGLTDKGKVYLHVKVYKARRIYGEILVLSGQVELRCRECYRWYSVTVPARGVPSLVETSEPETTEV
jgi:hypothetical protein